MRAHAIHTQNTGDHERALLAKASELRAQERPVEQADLSFGDFLRRENLRKVDTVEFSSSARQTATGPEPGVSGCAERADHAKFGSPRLGDVFPIPTPGDHAETQGSAYDKNGQTPPKAMSGFVAVMVDVIA